MSIADRMRKWAFSLVPARPKVVPFYFEGVLRTELAAVNARRTLTDQNLPRSKQRGKVGLNDDGTSSSAANASRRDRRSPDAQRLFSFAARAYGTTAGAQADSSPSEHDDSGVVANPEKPDDDRIRPLPTPCDATGLAFSGGGIRSAAICLGVSQALQGLRRFDSIDYLSTVSGGGYIGCCLSAAMSAKGGGEFPFGADKSDNLQIAHLRNYSNYLLPRGRSGVRNASEVAAILLRGLVVNFIPVFATLLFLAVLTSIAYPGACAPAYGSYLPNLIGHAEFWLFSFAKSLFGAGGGGGQACPAGSLGGDFAFTFALVGVGAVGWIGWALLRSRGTWPSFMRDTGSWPLEVASAMIVVTAVSVFLDIQPFALRQVVWLLGDKPNWSPWYTTLGGLSVAFSGVISVLGSSLGKFLEMSLAATDWPTLVRRYATQIAVFIAAAVSFLALWFVFLSLTAWLTGAWIPTNALARLFSTPVAFWVSFILLWIITFTLNSNSYSLHGFYRDRLSRAFLFGRPAGNGTEPKELHGLKLSDLRAPDGRAPGPYHIINAALNVQGSAKANRRGRNADFFIFTRDYVGSDLTHFAPTVCSKDNAAGMGDTDPDAAVGMEDVDPDLDVASAMAISGAAVSANMGGSTIRLLSPTFALLNIRLGYWLRNPRFLARPADAVNVFKRLMSLALEKFYLLTEMFNLLDETSRLVYLTDGGHVENLGVYELLKRGCKLIIAIDAEADPAVSFGALIKLERYARIDFGVRMVLPWGAIAATSKSVDASVANGGARPVPGPHCAVGRIFYADGAKGILIYFKSSLTGDEKDYVLDYKKRHSAFPHETTGDQFFSEEQFEVYRALGFHMVDHLFDGTDEFSFVSDDEGGFDNRDSALDAIDAALPATPDAKPRKARVRV